MRYLTAAAMFALLAALAGCGSSESPAPPLAPLTLEQLEQGAARFHDNDKKSTEVASVDRLPRTFTDSANHQVDLNSYKGESNLVLVVVKGFPPKFKAFCPGCLAQVNTLVANYAEFTKRDAKVFVVFPGSSDTLAQYLREGKVDGENGNPKIPFPILLDEDSKAIKALGIEGQLAKQSTFIIDKQGNVVFGYVGNPGDNYDRPSVKALTAQLDKLNGKK